MKDFLSLHLRDVPYFRALLRAVEAAYYEDFELPSPILDDGCGDGHFASLVFDHKVDVGIDPWHTPIQEAKKFGAYKTLIEADGAKIPFPDNYFASGFSNSVDPDGDALSYNIAAGPSHGTLTGTAPSLTYQPAANYNGADSFTFTVSDGMATSAPATVSISVTQLNDAPVANPQSVATQQNTAVAITLTGSDVDGDTLTYAIATPPAAGSLSGTAPALTYTPNSGYVGSDSFTFTVSDGTITSVPATVSITINPAGPQLHLGSSTSGTAGGVAFADEDVLIKDMDTGPWSLFIDGAVALNPIVSPFRDLCYYHELCTETPRMLAGRPLDCLTAFKPNLPRGM